MIAARIFLAVAIVGAAAILAFANRYSGGPSGKGLIWVSDRFTGRIWLCGYDGCIEPTSISQKKPWEMDWKTKNEKSLPALPDGFVLDKPESQK